ncbi:unnamed protein product [Parascedosporium putredinis]|uniref:Uncharacterized protein n=1 Tax=Parascedosporium putredinis TaxID=1442378 RepID=A0A9P1HB49_9PEZI|nr:unnamed protein product [Parascedosporium putredinis]CAI8003349.1 unnamed protein product [Parascedosporium putredinis]
MESNTKTPTLATTIARASYGVVVREVYKPEVHYNEDRETDAFDSRTVWAMHQIQWLIRKGDTIDPNEPLTKTFEIRLSAGDTTRSWNSTIVMSPNEPEFLPRSRKHPGVVTLCDIKSNLTGVEEAKFILKKKRRLCLRPGYKFYVCQFDVKVIVAPADLRFELWFDGEKFAGNHEPIAISWDENGTKVKTDEKEIRM